MLSIGMLSSLLLIIGAMLALCGRPSSPRRERTIVSIVMIAAGALIGLVTLTGEMGRPATALGLVLGLAGLTYGLRSVAIAPSMRRAVDDSNATRTGCIHSDPVIERLSRATNAVMWDRNLRTNSIAFSSTLKSILGYDESAHATNFDWWQKRIHPDDRTQTVESLKDAVRSGREQWECEYRFQRGDGTYAQVRDRGYFLPHRAESRSRMIGAMEEITSQRSTEDDAGDRELSFRTLADHAPDFIVRFDRKLRHVFVNQALIDAVGIPEDQYLGKTNRELGFDETLVDEWDRVLNSVFETGRPSQFSFTFSIDGRSRYLMARVTPEFNDEGEVATVLSIVRDITELKETNDRLALERAFVDAILNSMPGIFYLFTQEGRFIKWNDNFERISQYRGEEIAAAHPTEFFRGEEKQLIADRILEVFERGESWAEANFVSKDGSSRPFYFTGRRVMLDGRPHLVGMGVDMSELKHAEEKLRLSEARFATFMDCNPAAAWIKDEDGRYVYVNQRLCREYHVTPGEVLGRTDFDLLREDVARQLLRNDQAALESDEPLETTETINNPDGTDHVWLVVKFTMNKPGGGRLLGGFALDITEKQRAEQALREHAEALKRSNEELEQFAYVASHDLQEPLRMVASYTQLLADRYSGKLDKDADEFIRFAVDGAQRMQQLIDDLLLYSRVGSQGREASEVPVDEAVAEAEANLEQAIQECEATIERDRMPTVRADRVQLVQLFQNLLSNALKFRGDQPLRIAIRAERKAQEWIFSVSDNGIGIDPQYHERIFVIFQRLHGRAEHAGTGIGLAICKRIVEGHGGRIWVESSTGKGATFYFSIPTHVETVA